MTASTNTTEKRNWIPDVTTTDGDGQHLPEEARAQAAIICPASVAQEMQAVTDSMIRKGELSLLFDIAQAGTCPAFLVCERVRYAMSLHEQTEEQLASTC
ncbi:MAG: hypothetical protein FWD65_04390 [Coriobacteriia bacterium]|nr:hypothetical protein [Coriobacteriia bacterium]